MEFLSRVKNPEKNTENHLRPIAKYALLWYNKGIRTNV